MSVENRKKQLKIIDNYFNEKDEDVEYVPVEDIKVVLKDRFGKKDIADSPTEGTPKNKSFKRQINSTKFSSFFFFHNIEIKTYTCGYSKFTQR